MKNNLFRNRNFRIGMAFLMPNLTGFVLFSLFPLAVSLLMAFTDWDVRYHNMFRQERPEWVGFDNFVRLFSDPLFYKYLFNTVYLMLGIPVNMALSLLTAMLIFRCRPLSRRTMGWTVGILGLLLAIGMTLQLSAGRPLSVLTLILVGIGGLIYLGGGALGGGNYRTIFYLPHFTAGIAVYILWSKIYSPVNGPINQALTPVLEHATTLVRFCPPGVWNTAGVLLLAAFVAGAMGCAGWLVSLRREGEIGGIALIAGGGVLVAFCLIFCLYSTHFAWGVAAGISAGAILLREILQRRILPRPPANTRGIDGAIFRMLLGGTGLMLLWGIAEVLFHLPEAAGAPQGLQPPGWLTDYHWAKPSLMLMGFWMAVASNNMLLYLAALSGIPAELEEAAEVDGAGLIQRFRHIIWPQLMPVTFFIFIMSVIYGFQGGFESARAMTEGGPAGSTTTLAYYIYTEGFENGHLGYASAISWVMFTMIMLLTLFNWKVGNRYVND